MRRVALLGGPLLFVVTLVIQVPAAMEVPAWRVAGLASWMALWWLTGVVPLQVTALLPIVVLPIAGVKPIGEVTRSYVDRIIFLFLGGFLLAATLERWNLHRRFALATVRIVGTDAPRVVLAFMLASGFASMWISNTATTVMMLPIAKAVCTGNSKSFPPALMLAVAYGASIGGVATLIGTPPNAILAAAASELLDTEITFAEWLTVGLSVSIPMGILCWVWLIKLFHVKGEVGGLSQMLEREEATMGRLSGGERFVLTVFAATAAAWILRAPKTFGPVTIPGLSDLLPGISDAAIAILAALVLFVTPLARTSRFRTALDWDSARRIPWGILLLFGGGLALAGAFESSGLTAWVGGLLDALEGTPPLIIVLTCVTLFVFLTEITSNTATAALGMPLIAGAALGLGVEALPLMIAAAIAASMAFMLPVATPPNAIVFGSGAVKALDMARAGLLLNFVAIVVVTLVVSLWKL